MAGGKGSTYDNDLLKMLFNAVGIPNICDNAASAPLTNIYVSLHTADPGAGGTQSTSEAAYTGYARMAVARTSAGWVVTGNSVSPAAVVSFPSCTGGSETEVYAAAGTASTGTGKILYRGPITPSLSVASGVTPQLTTATALTES
jgi:hypothetical protein